MATGYGQSYSNVTLEEIDNFFSVIPKSNTEHKTKLPPRRDVPVPKSRGRLTDSSGIPIELSADDEFFIPLDRRQQRQESSSDYADVYKEKDDHLLLREESRDSLGPLGCPGVGAIGRGLDDISLDTESIFSDRPMTPCNDPSDIYTRYDFEHSYNKQLPIYLYRDQILESIDSNPAVVIQGSTGSGKTTQVPQYILDHHCDMGYKCSIVVTQPRRIAARSIATRVCHERNWEMGSICGYQVGLDTPEAGPDTRLLYVTTGVLIQKLIAKKNLNEYTHIVIDEVHERDQETDFLLLLARKLQRTISPNVKIVLMSATMDCDLFVKYFKTSVNQRFIPAPLIRVEGKMYNVSEYYVENLSALGPVPQCDPANPQVSTDAMNMAFNLIHELDKLENKEQGGDAATGLAESRGSVLVFLPGLYDIDEMYKKLSVDKLKNKLNIIPLHSSISITDQAKVFDEPKEYIRKVILATNIAESSITVPDIRYVIDFCLTKNLVTDNTSNFTSLQMEWCSKSNSQQRKGRAGRVRNGRVYRMVTKRFWNEKLPEFGIPEMQRCPLPQAVLNVKRLELGNPKEVLALCISPPNLADITSTILLLREIRALSWSPEYGPHDGNLTFLGFALSTLPVDVRLGKLIILGYVFGVLTDSIIIAAALSLKSVFTSPFGEELKAYKNKLSRSGGYCCDSFTVLETYKTWQQHKATGYFRRSGVKEVAWCQKNLLQYRRLIELDHLIGDVTKRLKNLNIHKPSPDHVPLLRNMDPVDNRLILKVVLCAAFYPNYFVQKEVYEDEINRTISGHDPLRTVYLSGLPSNQGVLYNDSIVDQFTDCDSKPPVIHYESSRAYVEFAPDLSENAGKIHPSVYIAVKRRHLKKPIEIRPLSAKDAKNQMELIENITASEITKDRRLRTNRVTMSGRRENLSLPPGDQSVLTVYVTEVVACANFWIQIFTDKTLADLQEICDDLNSLELPRLRETVKPGMLVAAPYSDDSSGPVYYRAEIYDIPPGTINNSSIVKVFYVDFGNHANVKVSELRQMSETIKTKPYTAIECFLSEVRPSVMRCPDGKWSSQANRFFKDMVINKQLFGKIYSQVGKTLHMDLIELCGNHVQINIKDELIKNGFAEPWKEPIASRQSHENRKLEGYGSHSTPMGFITLDADIVSTSRQRRFAKITLKGPFSPLEISFHSLTNAAKLRDVRVEQGSVNHVALNDDPGNSALRLMVAAFVGVSPNGMKITAHSTTIMPQIPGLPALMALLFCPSMELRVNQEGTRFTGAICGLGGKDDSNEPIFMENDMEITFDTEFLVADVLKVNAVRMAMNLILGFNEHSVAWGQDAVIKIQDSVRQSLLDLLKKKRKRIDLCFYNKQHRWNMVRKEDIIPPNLDTDTGCLYQLHSSVALRD